MNLRWLVEPTQVPPLVLVILGAGVLLCIGMDFHAGPGGVDVQAAIVVDGLRRLFG